MGVFVPQEYIKKKTKKKFLNFSKPKFKKPNILKPTTGKKQKPIAGKGKFGNKNIIWIIITIVVYVFIALFLVGGHSPGGNKNVYKEFNEKLNNITIEYFKDKLPREDGETKCASFSEIIASGLITSFDLEAIGSPDCTGNVCVGKAQGEYYYYYSDMTCGKFKTDNMYAAWSEWQDIPPATNDKNTQVQLKRVYNYGTSSGKYSQWSEWGENIEDIKEPEIPKDAEVINVEAEEKTQYSERTGSFKWYKLDVTPGDYHGGGALYEKIPASGYQKDISTKTVSSTYGPYTTEALLKTAQTGKDFDIETKAGYQTYTSGYIYSKVVTNGANCSSSTQLVQYSCSSGTLNGTKCVTSVKPTATAWSGCRSTNKSTTKCNGWTLSCTACTFNCGTTKVFNKSSLKLLSIIGSSKIAAICNGYKCPTACTSGTSTTPATATLCNGTHYLKSNGTATRVASEAALLTEAQYAALGVSGYTRPANAKIGWSDIILGSCPSGSTSSTCRSATLYYAKVYKYKWYIGTSSVKVWYNNGEYQKNSPGSEWMADTSTAKWDEWREWKDTKIESTATNQVRTQDLSRIRKQYVEMSGIGLETWLEKSDFEKKLGKTLEELKKDKNITIYSKLIYRYRTLIK